MKLTDKKFKLALIALIVFVTYNVLYFVIFGFTDHTAVFWMSWIFSLISLFALAATAGTVGSGGIMMRDWLFGYPLVRHTTIYIAVELVLCILFSAIEDMVTFAVAFVPQFLILAFYLVLAISCVLSKQIINDINTEIDDKNRFIKLLRADTEKMTNKCESEELKNKCRVLAESVRYSDPMSDPSLFELEKQLALEVAECDRAICEKNEAQAMEHLNKASLLLEERNLKCKALK